MWLNFILFHFATTYVNCISQIYKRTLCWWLLHWRLNYGVFSFINQFAVPHKSMISGVIFLFMDIIIIYSNNQNLARFTFCCTLVNKLVNYNWNFRPNVISRYLIYSGSSLVAFILLQLMLVVSAKFRLTCLYTKFFS